jgi:hypothetical protein
MHLTPYAVSHAPPRYTEHIVPFLTALVPGYSSSFDASARLVRSSDVFLWSVAVGAWPLASMLWTLTNSPVRFGLIGSLMCRRQAETPDALERPSGAETETLEAMAVEFESKVSGVID